MSSDRHEVIPARRYAIIPAAGRSARMGRPKLLLPWGESTVIEHVLESWRSAGVARRIVVTHRDDVELAARSLAAGAEVVTPSEPPLDMKASVRAALAYVQECDQPAPEDVWLLAPADMPRLSPTAITELLAAAPRHPGAVLVPTYQSRRGHPVLFRFSMAPAVHALASDQGVNQLLKLFPVVEIAVDDAAILEDMNTPADYSALRPHD